MRTILVTVVLLAATAAAEDRTYHPVALKDIATTRWTHACTIGRVTRIKREGDGDVHIRIDDREAFIVLETIPGLPLKRPPLHVWIEACGITRLDRAHKWGELHPLERWWLLEIGPGL